MISFRIWLVAVAGLALQGPAPLAAQSLEKTFDLSNLQIEPDEIRAGGPPKDGIPSIDHPKFVSPDRADFLQPDDLVLSLTIGGETRSYPLRILVYHELVNDVIRGKPILVTYCPLCGTAMIFDRKLDGESVEFGVSGLLYQSDVLMYDRKNLGLWTQLGTTAVSGKHAGQKLPWLSSEQMTFSAWKKNYPNGKVLSTDTGSARDYTRTPYRGYESNPGTMFPVPSHRDDLPQKTWVIGVIAEEQPLAFEVANLAEKGEIHLGGKRFVYRFDAASRRFRFQGADGRAIPHTYAYWFAWQAFYPKTKLFPGQ